MVKKLFSYVIGDAGVIYRLTALKPLIHKGLRALRHEICSQFYSESA